MPSFARPVRNPWWGSWIASRCCVFPHAASVLEDGGGADSYLPGFFGSGAGLLPGVEGLADLGGFGFDFGSISVLLVVSPYWRLWNIGDSVIARIDGRHRRNAPGAGAVSAVSACCDPQHTGNGLSDLWRGICRGPQGNRNDPGSRAFADDTVRCRSPTGTTRWPSCTMGTAACLGLSFRMQRPVPGRQIKTCRPTNSSKPG